MYFVVRWFYLTCKVQIQFTYYSQHMSTKWYCDSLLSQILKIIECHLVIFNQLNEKLFYLFFQKHQTRFAKVDFHWTKLVKIISNVLERKMLTNVLDMDINPSRPVDVTMNMLKNNPSVTEVRNLKTITLYPIGLWYSIDMVRTI